MINDPLEFKIKDPLAEFIINKVKWSPFRTAVIAFLYAWIIDLAVAGMAGRILPSPDYRSLGNDYLHFAVIILYPVIMGYYIWIYQIPKIIINKLEASVVISYTDTTKKQVEAILGGTLPSFVALILGLITGGLIFYQDMIALPAWHNSNYFPALFRVIFLNVPTVYAFWLLLFRYIINVRICSFILAKVVLHPLHPDKAGGFRPLGKYALNTTYPIVLAGTIMAFAEYWQYIKGGFATSYFYHSALLLLLILTPIIFFAPLRSAHDSMKRAKDSLLTDISTQFNHEFTLAHSALSSSSNSLEDNMEKIEQLQKLHKLATAFPVWPYDTETIRRFVVTMFTPVIVIGIPIVVNIISNLLTK
jgi:hypothetical protein